MSNDTNPQIVAKLLAAQEAGETVVLATIIKTRGSTPRHAGAKMIFYENGRSSGTIGGGELEARVRTIAQEVLQDGQPRTIPYTLVDAERGDPGVCGGELEVYCERYQPPATVLVLGCGHVGQAVASLAKWMGYRVVVSDDRPELVSPDVIPEADIYIPGSIEDVQKTAPITRQHIRRRRHPQCNRRSPHSAHPRPVTRTLHWRDGQSPPLGRNHPPAARRWPHRSRFGTFSFSHRPGTQRRRPQRNCH